jgi:hypothetical protein
MARKVLVNKRQVVMATVGSPSIPSIVLAVLATGLQVANQIVLAGDSEIQAAVTVVLVFLAAEHIKPLNGNLSVLVHLPSWLADLLSALAAATAAVLQIAGIGTTAHVIVLAVVTLLAALGFGGTAPLGPATR